MDILASAAAAAASAMIGVVENADGRRMERTGAAGSESGKTGCESHDETTVFSL